MTARFLFPLACGALVTLTSLRAEIRADDPIMVAALEDYAEFAAGRPETNHPKKNASPFMMAISDFFGLTKRASSPLAREE